MCLHDLAAGICGTKKINSLTSAQILVHVSHKLHLVHPSHQICVQEQSLLHLLLSAITMLSESLTNPPAHAFTSNITTSYLIVQIVQAK
jgi:hypothetical protein